MVVLLQNFQPGSLPDGIIAVDSEAGFIRYLVQSHCALYLRSVYVTKAAFHGLRCHPLTCISLKLRLSVDSTPTRFRHFSISQRRHLPFHLPLRVLGPIQLIYVSSAPRTKLQLQPTFREVRRACRVRVPKFQKAAKSSHVDGR